ncbi:MAG: YihY/virulence factor BrkB family protein [Tepidiformaceae bacterium]
MTSSPPVNSVLRRAQTIGDRCCIPGTTLGLGNFFRLLAHKIAKDNVTVLAGNVAFRLMFAFFPALIAILWLFEVLHGHRLVGPLLDVVGVIIPDAANGPIKEQVQQAPAAQATGAFTPGVGLSLVVAIGAIAVAFRATMHALNVIYAVEDRRSQLRRMALSVIVSFVTVALFVVAVALIVSGSSITASLAGSSGLNVSARLAWAATTWLVVLACIVSAFALTYYYGPDVKQSFRWVSTGSFTAVGLWLLFTIGFSIYINNFATPNQTYGALAGVAIFMLYLYSSSFILLLGAEMNQVIENWDPEGKNDGDRRPSG